MYTILSSSFRRLPESLELSEKDGEPWPPAIDYDPPPDYEGFQNYAFADTPSEKGIAYDFSGKGKKVREILQQIVDGKYDVEVFHG